MNPEKIQESKIINLAKAKPPKCYDDISSTTDLDYDNMENKYKHQRDVYFKGLRVYTVGYSVKC